MTKQAGSVTLQGTPFNLVGEARQVGDKAPDFKVIDNNLAPVGLEAYSGKIIILATVPSLDTPVCDMETRRFNSEAVNLGDDVVILTISMDLPFAQKRWCGAAGVDRLTTLSDHRDAGFGMAYGVLIEDLRLLARAVYVVDREGVIRYKEIVSEVAHEPDYDGALEAVRKCL